MSEYDVSRDLFFGLIALQNGLIAKEDLVAAFARWVQDKRQKLDALLVLSGAMDDATCRALWVIVEKMIHDQGGSIIDSLARLKSHELSESRAALEALDDADIRKSCVLLPVFETLYPSAVPAGREDGASERFRVLRPLPGGRGGMGLVQIARDEELGREVALKQIHPEKALQPALRKKFRLEAELTGNLEHPGIIPIYSLGTDQQGNPYYAMRYVQGENFSLAIKRFHQRRRQGLVDLSSIEFLQLLERLIQAAQAISYAHSRGVIHRDLKPENVLLGAYGETLVIDWGLAKLNLDLPAEQARETAPHGQTGTVAATEENAVWGSTYPTLGLTPLRLPSPIDSSWATQHGSFLGTPGYASPEQVQGQMDRVGNRSDVYSLGAILYHVLTGYRPGEKPNSNAEDLLETTIRGTITAPHEILRKIPRGLSAICMKSLALQPENRYATVREFIDELERWKADEPVRAVRENVITVTHRWLRKNRGMATTASLLGFAIVLVSSGLTMQSEYHRRNAQQAAQEAQRQEGLATTTLLQLAGSIQNVYGRILAMDSLRETAARPVRMQLLTELNAWIVQTADELGSNQTADEMLFASAGTLTMQANAWTDSFSSEESIAILQAAVSLAEEACLRNPSAFQFQRMRFMASNNLATRYKDLGQLRDAESLFKQNHQAQVSLLDDHPEHRQSLLYDISMARFNLAQIAIREGRWTNAMEDFNSAILHRRELADQQPDNAEYRDLLARTLYELATVHVRQKQTEQMHRLVEEVAELTGRTGPVWRDCQHMRAITLIAENEFDEAERIADEEEAFFQRERQAGKRRALRDLAYWLPVKMDIYSGQKRYQEVLKVGRETEELLDQLAAHEPGLTEVFGLACGVKLSAFQAAVNLDDNALSNECLVSYAVALVPWLYQNPRDELFRERLRQWIEGRAEWTAKWMPNPEMIAATLQQSEFYALPGQPERDLTQALRALSWAVLGLDDQAEKIVSEFAVSQSPGVGRRTAFLVAWLACMHTQAQGNGSLPSKQLLAQERYVQLTPEEQQELASLLVNQPGPATTRH